MSDLPNSSETSAEKVSPAPSVVEHDSLDSPSSENQSLSKIYTDAARYEKVLAGEGCCTLGNDTNRGFIDEIGSQLASADQNISERLSKLSMTGDTWLPEDMTAEPESYTESLRSSEKTLPGIGEEKEDSEYDSELFALHPRSASVNTSDSDESLSPVEIVQLLIDEFGSLATGQYDEPEKLILETNGALFQDVIILGIVHLTNYRLTFHASLLDHKPDITPTDRIIKTGPAVIHRKGWHSKRRVWLELSNDMFCTYASSRVEDRIRPLRTCLLSGIKKVFSYDSKHPKFVHVLFDVDNAKEFEGVLEFDTEESANDWRREMQGALFLYRHSRRQALNSNSEDSGGIRISIPLNRILKFERAQCLNTAQLLSLDMQLSQDDLKSFTIHDGPRKESHTIQFVTMRPDPQWDTLVDLVDTAKARPVHTGVDLSSVFVDFGPLSFFEEVQRSSLDLGLEGAKEQAVRRALALGAEKEIWVVRARIFRSLCSSGYFALSPHHIGFWSKSFTSLDARYRVATSIIKQAVKYDRLFHRGLAIEIEGHEDIRFEFKTEAVRDEAIRRINATVEAEHISLLARASPVTTPGSVASMSFDTLLGTTLSSPEPISPKSVQSPGRSASSILSSLSRTASVAAAAPIKWSPSERQKLPKAINLPKELLITMKSKHFMCLTIGSRGDVQPYIALGLGLKKEGHRVTIVTHEEYKDWVVGFGIEHRTAGGDPGALMKLSVENKMFSPEFIKESLTHFRPWLDQLLLDAWEQCKDADVLLESPSAMAGVHIAEALNIPYFRTFTMPWTKTTQFPHAFLSPPVEAPAFNAGSYVLYENIIWTATSGQINRWRRHTLNIGSTDMSHLAPSKITFIYNFSQAVVPKPLDWGDTTIVSGYWFLDNPDLDWKAPQSLLDWIAKAKKDKKPIVYIGFGSITVPRPSVVTDHIVKAVLKSGVRGLLSKGWSARMSKYADDPEVEIPPECYQLDKVPHDWLFPQIDAALHHGGAGTTGASLRAGIPTLIKPWFGDQFFWASRVQKIGAGLRVPSLRVNDLADAMTKATTSRLMKEKAASIGERIRSEDGVHSAIHAIYTYLPRASRDRTSLD